jgi:hypothetical protein
MSDPLDHSILILPSVGEASPELHKSILCILFSCCDLKSQFLPEDSCQPISTAKDGLIWFAPQLKHPQGHALAAHKETSVKADMMDVIPRNDIVLALLLTRRDAIASEKHPHRPFEDSVPKREQCEPHNCPKQIVRGASPPASTDHLNQWKAKVGSQKQGPKADRTKDRQTEHRFVIFSSAFGTAAMMRQTRQFIVAPGTMLELKDIILAVHRGSHAGFPQPQARLEALSSACAFVRFGPCADPLRSWSAAHPEKQQANRCAG